MPSKLSANARSHGNNDKLLKRSLSAMKMLTLSDCMLMSCNVALMLQMAAVCDVSKQMHLVLETSPGRMAVESIWLLQLWVLFVRCRFFRKNGEAGRSWCGGLILVLRRLFVGFWLKTCPSANGARAVNGQSVTCQKAVATWSVGWSHVGA